MSTFCRIVAEVKFIRHYICAACGVGQPGDTQRTSLDVGTPHELEHELLRQPQLPHYMPVGWSYNGKYTCPTCLKGQP